MKSFRDAFIQIGIALMFAAPLAFGAFLWQRAGWHAFVGYMVLVGCAFIAGRVTAQEKWMRDLDARVEALKKEYDDDDGEDDGD